MLELHVLFGSYYVTKSGYNYYVTFIPSGDHVHCPLTTVYCLMARGNLADCVVSFVYDDYPVIQ